MKHYPLCCHAGCHVYFHSLKSLWSLMPSRPSVMQTWTIRLLNYTHNLYITDQGPSSSSVKVALRLLEFWNWHGVQACRLEVTLLTMKGHFVIRVPGHNTYNITQSSTLVLWPLIISQWDARTIALGDLAPDLAPSTSLLNYETHIVE